MGEIEGMVSCEDCATLRTFTVSAKGVDGFWRLVIPADRS
jgi:hypothetical protein